MCTICAHGAQNEMQHLQIYRVCAHNVNNEMLLVFPQFRGKLEVIGGIFLLGLSILKDCFWLNFGASKVEKAFL